jgi:hypothetical protein
VAGRRALQGNALWAATYRILATCYAHLGRLDDARAAVQRLPQTDLGLTVGKLPSFTAGATMPMSRISWQDSDLRACLNSGRRRSDQTMGEDRVERPPTADRQRSAFKARATRAEKIGNGSSPPRADPQHGYQASDFIL